MEKDEIDITDIGRILVGDGPAAFLAEVILRILFAYILAMVSIRLMGKRMAARLSKNELAALVSLAAAIGIPAQTAERGLLPSVIVAIVIIVISRSIATLAYRNRKFERISQGDHTTLVKDAVLQVKAMEKSKLNKERIFAQLRHEELTNLGSVKRLYLEANGTFSLVKTKSPHGLSLIPDWDADLISGQEKVPGVLICSNCGYKKLHEAGCPNCGNTRWVAAVMNRDKDT